jgi:hypothetical protein
MTRKFAVLLAMVLCGTGIVLVPDRANAQTNLTRAVVQTLRNRVKLLPNSRQPRPARVNDQLYPKDALSTGQASRADLRFNDGSLARIGERTLFRFTPKTRRFQLNNGTVLLLIPPGKGRTQIKTPNAAAGIRGSALFVRYIPESDTTLIGALTNSQIEVVNKDETQTQPLAAGQIAVVVKDRIERLYEFDLRTFYETSPMVEGLDLSGKGSSTNSDEAIAQVRAETVEAVRSQQQVVGERLDPNRNWIATTPRDGAREGFSPPDNIISKEPVENPNDPRISPPLTQEDRKPPTDDKEPPTKIPDREGEEGGRPKQPKLPETPAPVGRGIQKVSVSPNTPPPTTKDEGEQEPSTEGGVGQEKPKDNSGGSEGSGGQGQSSGGQGRDRPPAPEPPKGGNTGSGENRDRPSAPEPPKGGNTGSGENRDRPPAPEPPKGGSSGVEEGDRKSPPRVEAERPERPRESNDMAGSRGNETQPKVPEAARPDVPAATGSFSTAIITGNTDPNPAEIAPIAVIDPTPPSAVVNTPGNPASVPAPPVSATVPATTPTPSASSVTPPNQGSAANSVTTTATPAPTTGGTIDPGNTGSTPTTGGVSTVTPDPVVTPGSTPAVIDPVDPVTPGNPGGVSSPVIPAPDPSTAINPTGTPPQIKPIDPPVDPGLTSKPGTIDPTPIDPGATAPNPPTVIDPPAPSVVDPLPVNPPVNTPVVDPPVVNTPVVDPPVVNTPVIDPPVVNTPVIDPPVVNTPVIDPPVINTPPIDPSTLPVNNLPIDPNSSISPINNTTPTVVDPNTPQTPDPGTGLPGNANSGNPNGNGNPNPGNPNGNPNPGNPNVP